MGVVHILMCRGILDRVPNFVADRFILHKICPLTVPKPVECNNLVFLQTVPEGSIRDKHPEGEGFGSKPTGFPGLYWGKHVL